jgi:hypothetical protein
MLVTVAVPGTVLVSWTVTVAAGPTGEQEADSVDSLVEVITDVTVVPEPPTVFVETTVEKMVDVPAGTVTVVFPPARVDVTVETIVEVPAASVFVNVEVTTLVTVSAGATGVQLFVSVTTSVVPAPATVEKLVMYEVTVCSAPAGVHEGQDGVSVLVTTLVITLGGEVGHVPGDVTVTPGRVTVIGLQVWAPPAFVHWDVTRDVIGGSVTVTALLLQVSGEHELEIVSVETTVFGLQV